VLDDFTGKYSPAGWASQAIKAYEQYGADAIVVERNFGGDMVENTLRNAKFEGRVIQVRASHGKEVRAEPTVGLYEQRKVAHLLGADLAELEDEQLMWVPGEGSSPNRIDAVVWAMTDLSGKGPAPTSFGIPRSIRRAHDDSKLPKGFARYDKRKGLR
jgi:phage terminase large subunit-like protein